MSLQYDGTMRLNLYGWDAEGNWDWGSEHASGPLDEESVAAMVAARKQSAVPVLDERGLDGGSR
jgi:hypothetical protein